MPTTLTKGANCPVPGDRIAVEIVSGAGIDVSALLVTEAGKVRSDDDFVFYYNEWLEGQAVLGQEGGEHLDQVIQRLRVVPFAVIIQPEPDAPRQHAESVAHGRAAGPENSAIFELRLTLLDERRHAFLLVLGGKG